MLPTREDFEALGSTFLERASAMASATLAWCGAETAGGGDGAGDSSGRSKVSGAAARGLLEARLALRALADLADLHHLSLGEDDEGQGDGKGDTADLLSRFMQRESVPAIVWGADTGPVHESSQLDDTEDEAGPSADEDSSDEDLEGAHGFYISRKKQRSDAPAVNPPATQDEDTIVVNYRG
jgi:hypothetical protein